MTTRHTLTLAALLAVAAGGCNLSHSTGGDTDSGVGTPDGGDGVCCPLVDWFPPCAPGSTPLPGGGWAPSRAECTYTIVGFDRDFDRSVDARGCPLWELSPRCCGCVDAGPPEPPPPPPSACEGLGEVACLGAPGCVPTYHDACCSSCEPGVGCADCVDWEFWTCRTYEDACEATFCSVAGADACGGSEPLCATAHPTGLGSCDVPGCVPAVAAEGFMEPLDPCVAVTAQSCTVACRSVPPTCPDGTTAQGDGSCWTGRCIPRSVCGG